MFHFGEFIVLIFFYALNCFLCFSDLPHHVLFLVAIALLWITLRPKLNITEFLFGGDCQH